MHNAKLARCDSEHEYLSVCVSPVMDWWAASGPVCPLHLALWQQGYASFS